MRLLLEDKCHTQVLDFCFNNFTKIWEFCFSKYFFLLFVEGDFDKFSFVMSVVDSGFQKCMNVLPKHRDLISQLKPVILS